MELFGMAPVQFIVTHVQRFSALLPERKPLVDFPNRPARLGPGASP